MTTAVNSVGQAIKNGILSGEFPAGTYVREEAIATKLAVSRTPVRESIRQLVSEGWLESIPNRGAQVVQWSEKDVREIFAIRSSLEPMAAKRSAAYVTEAHVKELSKLDGEMNNLCAVDSIEARDSITMLNKRFHEIIYETAHSPRLQHVLESVVVIPIVRRSFHDYTREELQRSMYHHGELIRAFGVNDGEWAGAIMRLHVLAARAVYMRQMSLRPTK